MNKYLVGSNNGLNCQMIINYFLICAECCRCRMCSKLRHQRCNGHFILARCGQRWRSLIGLTWFGTSRSIAEK